MNVVLYGPDGKPLSILVGNVAHDEVDSGNPIKLGGKASTDPPTAVAVNDRVNVWLDTHGILQVTLRDADGATLGSGRQYIEDGAIGADAGQGTLLIARRDDALSALNPAEGDAVGLRVDANGGLWVDVAASALPTGAATETTLANVEDGILSGNGTLGSISGAVAVVAGAVAGSEMQVDVLTVPADPFGANADAVVAAGAAGSIQAKLRRLTTDLDAIKTSVAAAIPAGNNNIGDVDVASLPALVASSANIGDVDVLTVPADPFGANADALVAAGAAGSIQAKLRRLTQGLEDLKTTIVLAAGSAVIGKLAANSGVDIGDVDVTSVPADPFGVNADAVVAAGAAGSIQAKLRRLTTDLDAIKTSVAAATPAGTNNIGDVDVLTVPADPFGANADAIVAAGAVGSIQAKLRRLTQGVEDLKTTIVLAAGTANIGDVDVLTLPADPLGANADAVVAAGATGSISAKLRRVTQGLEDLKTLIVLGAGSAAIGKLAANSGVDIGDVDVTSLPNVTLAAGTNTNEVVGDVAEDAALAGNPVRQGVRASTAVPTAMSADGDVVTPWANRNGAQVVAAAPHIGLNADPFSLTTKTAQYTTTQTGVALVTPTGGKKLVVTKVQIQVGGTTAGTMQLWFGGSADTTYTRGTDRAIFDGEFAPSASSKPGVVMDGPWIAGAADDILRVTDSAAINPLTVTVWYYEI